MNELHAAGAGRIPGDPESRYWVEISGANPQQVAAFRPCLVGFLVYDSSRHASFAGTGFVIAGSADFVLVLSAKHVFDHVSSLQNPPPSYRSPSPFLSDAVKKPVIAPGSLHAVWMDNGRAEMLNVAHLGYNATLDIGCAILMPQNGKLRSPAIPIDTSVPNVGDIVHMVSLDDMRAEEKAEPVDRSGKGQIIEVNRRVSIRVGTVTALHPAGLRQFKWPCFTTSIPAEAGMSGGFVYLPRDGQTIAVCGVVSADASPEESKRDFHRCGESIVACAWPSLALPVPTETRDDAPMLPIYEMVRRGAIPMPVGGIDGIEVKLNDDGTGMVRRMPR